jgi:hypothetical protein
MEDPTSPFGGSQAALSLTREIEAHLEFKGLHQKVSRVIQGRLGMLRRIQDHVRDPQVLAFALHSWHARLPESINDQTPWPSAVRTKAMNVLCTAFKVALQDVEYKKHHRGTY